MRRKGIFGELQNLRLQTRELEITNTGQETNLNISSVAITGIDADNYAVSGVADGLGPREKGKFTVTFNPKGQVGGSTAFLEFTSDYSGDEVTTTDLSALIPNTNGLPQH